MMTQVQGHSRDPSKDFIRGRCGRGVRPYRFPRPAPISTPTSSGSPSSTTIIFPTIGPTSPINVVESPPPIDTPYHFYSSETPNRPHLSPLVVLSTIGSFPRHPVPPTPPARPVQPTFRPTANIPPLYTKPLSWRTTPCRHFSKRGYCPLGDNCNFIHDPMFTSTGPQRLSQHASATQQPSDQKDSADTTQSNYNRIGGVVNVEVSSAPKKQSHCWAHVQGLCRLKDCQYFHPQDITPYIKYTPCTRWPICELEGCPYRHPQAEDIPSSHPLGLLGNGHPPFTNDAVIPYGPTLPQALYSPLPHGSFNCKGTTYFPPPIPIFPQTTMSHQGLRLHHATPYPYHNYIQPFASSLAPTYSMAPIVPDSLPAEDSVTTTLPISPLPGPDFEDTRPVFNTNIFSGSEPKSPVAVVDAPLRNQTAEFEFPYRPPQKQRIGHARRVSIAVKHRDDSAEERQLNGEAGFKQSLHRRGMSWAVPSPFFAEL